MKKALVLAVILLLVACFAQATDKWIIQYGEAEMTSCGSNSQFGGAYTLQSCYTSPKQVWCDTKDCVREELLKGNATHVWKLSCYIGGMIGTPSNPCFVEEYNIITAKDIKPKK
jgi:hypothetical protein